MKIPISSIRLEVINLRKQGKSYNEINKILNIPKSTLSGWLKHCHFSEKIKKNNFKKAKLIWAKNITAFNKLRSEKYQKETRQLIEKYARGVPTVSRRDLYFIGLSLFWAEGGKREKWAIKFCNSDALIIKTIMKFFREICNVPNKKFSLRIHLYPNIKESYAIKFWSRLIKLPPKQFRKSQTQISKSSKNKRPFNRLPYGTLHITIGDAYLNKKIKGWLLGLEKQFN